MRAALLAVLAALLGSPAAAGTVSAAPPTPAEGVELARFFGRWYVIADMPDGRRRDFGAYFEYRARPDGGIDDVYSAHEDSFERPAREIERVARADPAVPARWRVNEGWFTSSDRLLLYVSPDYRYAIAGDADRSHAWLLAREPEIAAWSYAGLLARLAMQGYDVSRLRRVPQRAGDAGRAAVE